MIALILSNCSGVRHQRKNR